MNTNDKFPISSESPYFKLNEGTNRIRIMDAFPLTGWQYFEDTENGRKPVRVPTQDKDQIPKEKFTTDNWQDKAQEFWAFPVYNLDASKFQVWLLTQINLRRDLKNILENQKFGRLTNYDLNVKKTIDGKKTSYTVVADPPTDLPKELKEEFNNLGVTMGALYVSGHPMP